MIDETAILEKMNKAMGTTYLMSEIKDILASQRTKHEAAVCYRLLYDTEYENIINYMKT